MAHDGGLQLAVQLLHEAIGRWMIGSCPAEMDIAQLRQVVEELRLELAHLVGGDGLWTAKS